MEQMLFFLRVFFCVKWRVAACSRTKLVRCKKKKHGAVSARWGWDGFADEKVWCVSKLFCCCFDEVATHSGDHFFSQRPFARDRWSGKS